MRSFVCEHHLQHMIEPPRCRNRIGISAVNRAAFPVEQNRIQRFHVARLLEILFELNVRLDVYKGIRHPSHELDGLLAFLGTVVEDQRHQVRSAKSV